MVCTWYVILCMKNCRIFFRVNVWVSVCVHWFYNGFGNEYMYISRRGEIICMSYTAMVSGF